MDTVNQVKLTFTDNRAPSDGDHVIFVENVENNNLQSLGQTINCMQTKMNYWLTEKIEKERGTNPTLIGNNGNLQDDDAEEEDDEEDSDSEPPAKQPKT